MSGKWLETKTKRGRWRYIYTYITRRKPKYRRSRVRAKQYAIKTSSNTYSLRMKGTKTARRW